DHVATVLEDVKRGDEVGIHDAENILLYTMTASEDIPFGNKIALCPLKKGDLLVKYGAPIGLCTHDIPCGWLVHVHNVKSRTVDIPPAFKKEIMRQMHIEEVEP
ncbi:MAG: UxaA family hydrolase, partial [Butyricicoccus sp.]